MTEIDLQITGKGGFEYYAESVPRNGDYISVNVDEIKGTFMVYNVVHRVFKSKGEFHTYVTIYAEVPADE